MAINGSKLKVGLIGLGKMGIMHACLLNVLPNVQVTALCDRSRLMRRIAKQAFRGAVVTDALDKFLALHLDAIYVLTPIPIHYRIIKEIYEKEITKNVFVEKTLASNYSHSAELCLLAEAQGGVNMVGYMKRFGVTFNHAKSLLCQQVLGELTSFDAYAFSSDFSQAQNGPTVSRTRGGALVDLGSHVVDLAVWFFEDLKVTVANAKLRTAPDLEDEVSFGVEDSNGLQGMFEVSWCKDGYRMPEFGLSVHGTRGTLRVNDDEVELTLKGDMPKNWFRQDLNDTVGFLLGGPEYYREDKHFIDMIISGQTAKPDFRSALKVDYILEQVRRRIADD